MGPPAEPFDLDPVELFCHHVFQARLQRFFPPGAQVLDVGGGPDAEALVLAERGVRVVPVATAEDAVTRGRGFDGAYAGPGTLARADLVPLVHRLRGRLRAQAPLMLCVVGGALSFRDLRRQFGSAFVWSDAFALGVLLPRPSHAAWAVRSPQAFALLAIAERLVRRWPVLRGRGRYVVVEGVRT